MFLGLPLVQAIVICLTNRSLVELSIIMEFLWNLSGVSGVTIATFLRGKAGVYQWINNTNGKTYVGSSVDLYRRFFEYLNPKHLIRELLRGESLIYRAMLKYGYTSFSFKILEIVPLDSSLSDAEQNSALLAVEQQYLDLLTPEYNLLQKAGSNRGHKLSEESKAKMSASKKGKPSNRKGSTHTNESKLLIKQNNAKATKVYLYNFNLEFIKEFDSILDSATVTGVSRWRIARAIKEDTNRNVDGFIFRNSQYNPM
jgi:hypothetical protein